MLVRDIKELLEGYDDDWKFGWNVFWKVDADNSDAEPCFPPDMIKDMELSLFSIDERDEEDEGE